MGLGLLQLVLNPLRGRSAFGRHEEALVWLEMITESSIYGQIYAAPAHRLRARIYQELGAADSAAEHLRAFRELWGEGALTQRPRREWSSLRGEKPLSD